MSDAPSVSRGSKGWRFARQHWQLSVGLGTFALIATVALFAPVIAPFEPDQINLEQRLLPPGLPHLFGTDELGRDVFSRVIHGARVSLIVGFSVVGMALLIGLPLGLLAGYIGGVVDTALMRVADIFLAFPPLLLPLAITAALGPNLYTAMLALAISWFPWYARILRASVIATKQELYISAARAAGVHRVVIMFRHVLPNSITAVLAQASMDYGYAILAAAALSFIGMGAQPPQTEWGLMIADARGIFFAFWWTATFPGLAIFLTVFAVNLFGDGLNDYLNVKGHKPSET